MADTDAAATSTTPVPADDHQCPNDGESMSLHQSFYRRCDNCGYREGVGSAGTTPVDVEQSIDPIGDFVEQVWALTNDRDGWSRVTLRGAAEIFARRLTATPPPAVSAQVQCADCSAWIDRDANHTCRWCALEVVATILSRYFGKGETADLLVDEVQRRMDHVVETAVEWHQAGREGGEWFDAAEKLGAAIDSLLELRDKPAAPASPSPGEPQRACAWELENGWVTSTCGESWLLSDEWDGEGHGMKFCSYCGARLVISEQLRTLNAETDAATSVEGESE